ncbi:hypothetical protein [Staphylococcus xylosus]|uniref:hypothetical protein n=1 Tax=Staphylococcus xylosus TaxID=1288 RepID=UPI003F557E28
MIVGNYHYNEVYDEYINLKVWRYMENEDVDLETALNHLGLDYIDALPDEEDLPELEKEKQKNNRTGILINAVRELLL